MILHLAKWFLIGMCSWGLGGNYVVDTPTPDPYRNKVEVNYTYSEVGELYVENWDSNFCSCVLIEPELVVTAAHCVDNWVFETEWVGVVVRFKGTDSYTIKSWHLSDNWDAERALGGDIALIVLDEPVTGVLPARLRTRPVGLADMYTTITQVGYGGDGNKRTTLGLDYMFGGLAGTDLIIWSAHHSQLNGGDSGGAVFAWDYETGGMVLIGISVMVWYEPPYDSEIVWMNAATRVDLYADWINNHTGEDNE